MKKRVTILAGLGVALLTHVAIAGYVQPFPVEVDLVNMLASGDQVTARYSSNEVVNIGCGIRKMQDGAGGIYSYGFCQARDAAKEQILCSTEDPGLLEVMASSGDYGYITFRWNEKNECTYIGFSNQSLYLPKGLGSNI